MTEFSTKLGSNQMKYFAIATCTFALVACGGGGGGGTSSAVNDTSGNPFLARVGTYISGCQDDTPNPSQANQSAKRSVQITLTISAPTDADKASVSMRRKLFSGSDTCNAAAFSQDLTVSGQLTAISATKTITVDSPLPSGWALSNKITGTASEALFRFDAYTLSTGGISGTVPAFGVTTKVGYMFSNGKLYGLFGPRDTDGVGQVFSNVYLTKQ